MDEAIRPLLPETHSMKENNYKTVNYSCISGSSRNHQARTARGVRIHHPTREFPQFKQDLAVEYAGGRDAPDTTAIPGDSGKASGSTCRTGQSKSCGL